MGLVPDAASRDCRPILIERAPIRWSLPTGTARVRVAAIGRIPRRPPTDRNRPKPPYSTRQQTVTCCGGSASAAQQPHDTSYGSNHAAGEQKGALGCFRGDCRLPRSCRRWDGRGLPPAAGRAAASRAANSASASSTVGGKEEEGAPAGRLLQHAAGHASGTNGPRSRSDLPNFVL